MKYIAIIYFILVFLAFLIALKMSRDTFRVNKQKTPKIGFLFRLGSFWIGVHYSKNTRRTCINFLPCCTIWIGNKP
jgi:hypothetical protein